MGIFSKDYEKAGSGVAKNAPKKKAFFGFFELYFRYAWRLIKLNILTFIFCIPIVTIGPAIAGMTKVLKNYSLDKHSFMFHDFWSGFTGEWKRSLPLGLLDILFTVSAVSAVQVYPQMAANAESGGFIYNVLCVVSVSFALLILVVNFYAFPMMVATDLSFKNIIKNSFFLACLGLKNNIFSMLAIALTLFVFFIMSLVSLLTYLLIPFWLITFLGFIIMFNSYPQIQKYVINPFYEAQGRDNPEYDYLKPLDIDDNVFLDRGGEEAPIEGKSKKGKIIS